MHDIDLPEHEHGHSDSFKQKGIIAKMKNILTLGHTHEHNISDTFVENSREGITAVKLSFIGLMITALFQIIIV